VVSSHPPLNRWPNCSFRRSHPKNEHLAPSMTWKKLKSSMLTSTEMTSSKSKRVMWSLPSRNSTQMLASQVPLAVKMPSLTAIPIHAEEAADEADEVVAAVMNLANHPMSEVPRQNWISKKVVTMSRPPRPVDRVATSVLKIARRVRQNAPTENQSPSS
jgi:hypothetical protein